jgi:Mg-chelatase subunit ChlD
MSHPHRLPRSRRRERGIAIMLTAVMLFVLVPVAGLALDAVLLYALKAKLSTAADAAAIAAARSLNVGMTLAEQEAEARQRALDFFRANLPNNAYNTSNHVVNVNVAETAFRTRTVTVNAAISAPQYFMRWLGFSSTRINALGRASRRDVNLILVLDRSYSMRDDVAAGNPCTTMRNASTTFVNMFAEGRDRLGLITYGSSTWSYAPTMNFKSGGSSSMPSRIGQIACDGNTSTAMAASRAYEMLQAIDEPGALNLIVLFTDGWPNGVTADYSIRRINDNRYGGARRDTSTTRQINTRMGTSQTNTGTTYNMEPSPCRLGSTSSTYHYYNMRCMNSSCSSRTDYSGPNWNPNFLPGTRRGVLSQWAGDLDSANTGQTAGLMVDTATSVTATSEPLISGMDDCAANSTSNRTSIRRDIAFIPDSDVFGNSTRGYYGFPGNMLFGSGHPYEGSIRPEMPRVVTRASINATDNAAARIRNDTTLNPVFYVIGLGEVNHELNRRMTNDPTSPIHDRLPPRRPVRLRTHAHRP